MKTISRSRKVLLSIQEACPAYVGMRAYIQDARDFLNRLGYTVHVQTLANKTTGQDYDGTFFAPDGSQGTTAKKYWDIDTSDYDFVILPRYPGNGCDAGSNKVPEEWIKAARRQLPIFVEAFDDGRTGAFIEQVGVDASERTTSTYQLCTYAGPMKDITVAEYTHTYPILAGEEDNVTPLVSVSAGAAIGDMVAWIHRPAGVAPVYASAVQHTSFRRWLLPLLLAEAVSRDDIPAPPNKIALFHDFDDVPDINNTLAEVEFALSVMSQHALPMTWGIHAQDAADNFDASPAAVKTLTLANQISSGGLIYPIDHYGNDFASTNSSTIQTSYLDLIGRMQSWGFVTGSDVNQRNQWGYRYFNNHNVGRQALPLLKGWGHRAIRVNDSSSEPNALKGRGIGAYRSRVNGMELVGYAAYGNNTADPADAETVAGVCRALMINAMVSGHALALHGSDLYDGHDGGTAGGQWAFETVSDLVEAMETICEWKHPGDVF